MIRFFLFVALLPLSHAHDRLRKISGDAAPEKAQEPIEGLDEFIPTIDSSVQLDHSIPEPPALVVSLPVPPRNADKPRPPAANRPLAAPPSAQVAPPSVRPPEAPATQTTTVMPPPVTTSFLNENRTTTSDIPYDQVTVDIDELLPQPSDDLEEFQKADLLENEKNEEVKDVAKKTTVNTTDDYYITSSATTVTSELQGDTIGQDDVFDFDRLFDKKIASKQGSATTTDETTTTGESTTTSTTAATSPGSTTSEPVTASTIHAHKKTCVHVEDLKQVDDSVTIKGTKKGTIEVSVELGEDDFSDEDDASEEEGDEEATEAPVRQVREDKKHVVWKKFEMNCDEEEDEKGNICKLWAAGGLCGRHKPTMFLFCRKTCLCVGPN